MLRFLIRLLSLLFRRASPRLTRWWDGAEEMARLGWPWK